MKKRGGKRARDRNRRKLWLIVGIAVIILLVIGFILSLNGVALGPPIELGEFQKQTPDSLGKIEPPRCIEVWTAEDLDNVRNDLDGNYCQMADIDLSGWDWEPIGSLNNPFEGFYDGGDYKISNLVYSGLNNEFVGLFSFSSGTIRRVNLESPRVKGKLAVGSLVGNNAFKIIDSNVLNGTVEGESVVGGLVGQNDDFAEIRGSSYRGKVYARSASGGLVGINLGNIFDSYSKSDVFNISSDSFGLGGFIGFHGNGDNLIVDNCYSGGVVYCSKESGGFVGKIDVNSVVNNSYSDVSVYCSGGNSRDETWAGGFAGYSGGEIINSYSAGRDVEGKDVVGGFIGYCWDCEVTNSYSVTEISSLGNYDSLGGFIGRVGSPGVFESSYWDIEASGQTDGCGTGLDCPNIEGKTTAEMKMESTFVGWDFTNIWDIIEEETYPFLRWE